MFRDWCGVTEQKTGSGTVWLIGCSLPVLSALKVFRHVYGFRMLIVALRVQLQRVHGVLDYERGSIARHFSASACSAAVKEDGMCFSPCAPCTPWLIQAEQVKC
jgi:hypothetical protein